MSAGMVILEWQFSPPDCFEEPLTITRDNYVMVIGGGRAKAAIDASAFDANPSMRAELHEALRDRLHAVQFKSCNPFELSQPTLFRRHADGRMEHFAEPGTGQLKTSEHEAHLKIAGMDENVHSGTRRDRIEKMKGLGELVGKQHAGSPLLTSLLKSHDAAVRDPDNELVHLFEIRESLSRHFHGNASAWTKLGIGSSDWRRFGTLCNDEPLRQGRHRGKHAGKLRDATQAELTEARSIAGAMIEAYLNYKSGQHNGATPPAPNGEAAPKTPSA